MRRSKAACAVNIGDLADFQDAWSAAHAPPSGASNCGTRGGGGQGEQRGEEG
jgi:hypothetical protein